MSLEDLLATRGEVVLSKRVRIPTLSELRNENFERNELRRINKEAREELQRTMSGEELKRNLEFLDGLDELNIESPGSIYGSVPSPYRQQTILMNNIKGIDSPMAIDLLENVSKEIPSVKDVVGKNIGMYRSFIKDKSSDKAIKEKVYSEASREWFFDACKAIEQRNRRKIAENGAQAVCAQHFVRLELHQTAHASVYWCPVCHDDEPVYTGVKTIMGVLSHEFSSRDHFENGLLHVNLSGCLKDPNQFLPLDLDEIFIGSIDPYEVELFITTYKSERKYTRPSLKNMKCKVSSKARLPEHTRRLLLDTFAAVEGVRGTQ